MFKAGGKAGSTPLLILGLDLPTIQKLLEGYPVQFPTGQLGVPHMQVLLVFGPTTDFIKARLADIDWLRVNDAGQMTEASEVSSPLLTDWTQHLMQMGGRSDPVTLRTGPAMLPAPEIPPCPVCGSAEPDCEPGCSAVLPPDEESCQN